MDNSGSAAQSGRRQVLDEEFLATTHFRPWPASSLAGLTLGENEIHLWCAGLNPPAPQFEDLGQTLSRDEHERATRFRFDRDRKRYTASRGLLRSLLAAYLEVAPSDLRFAYSAMGKPALAGRPLLHFNLSHSEDVALFAIARKTELGVDLEYIRPLPDAEAIAKRFFSKAEYTTLLDIPRSRKIEAFFECWTRKEAYVKAVGDGLAAPLSEFDVSLAPELPARIVRIQGSPERAADWSLFGLRPVENYVGALAVRGRGWNLMSWRWNDFTKAIAAG